MDYWRADAGRSQGKETVKHQFREGNLQMCEGTSGRPHVSVLLERQGTLSPTCVFSGRTFVVRFVLTDHLGSVPLTSITRFTLCEVE